MRPAVIALAVLAVGVGCGDNLSQQGEPLSIGASLTVVAHQDDDLLFMQPDLVEDVELRVGLTNIYITSGGELEKSDKRSAGLMEAYAEAAGLASSWQCGQIELAGHAVEHCRLADANVSLVFLGYPDGGKEGQHPNSLLRLWMGEVDDVETIARHPTRFDRDGLIAAVADAIGRTQPATIRTLDFGATHGRDHVDHMIAGVIALHAVAESGFAGELLAFRGYNIEVEPETLIDPLYDRSANVLSHYEACATDCAACGMACKKVPEFHGKWLRRRYPVGFRRPTAGEAVAIDLRMNGSCVIAAGDALVLGSCGPQPALELRDDGTMRVGRAKCVEAQASGEISLVDSCAPRASTRFYLDEEGRLWAGAPLAPELVEMGMQVQCLGAGAAPTPGARVGFSACGASFAPAWELTSPAMTLARPTWLPATGRLTRSHAGTLFAVVGGELVAARGRIDDFDPPIVLGPLPIEPESLIVGTLGGIDRACGRDANGILCTNALVPSRAERWSTAFAYDGPATSSDHSLSAFAGKVCGVSDEGVLCAPQGATLVAPVLSRWPAPEQPLWIGDLDGDGHADWCSTTGGTLACGRDRERVLTTDGVPWAFANGGAAPASPSDPALATLHDIDGDGRSDLCMVEQAQIVCARSSRHGFGPRFAIGTLTLGTPKALWFHGVQRACVDDGARVECVTLAGI